MQRKSIVILTGAGVSAESGIRTFRDQNGLWEDHRIEDVASPEGFVRNPILVHNFYNLRRRQLKDAQVQPNVAHFELAAFEKIWPGEFLLVTQNVDDLHDRAGSQNLIHMHGELTKIFCRECRFHLTWSGDLSLDDSCPACHKKKCLRPDIVWFGEMPYELDKITAALITCDLFVAIGTSGNVYPAAGFVRLAPQAKRVEINVAESEISRDFHEHRIGPAGREVPKLLQQILTKTFVF